MEIQCIASLQLDHNVILTSYVTLFATKVMSQRIVGRHTVHPKKYADTSCCVVFHEDVIKWKHFRIIGSLCGSPDKGQWRGALMFSLICAWINGWVKNRETGDLRRNRAHYDVTVMWFWWDIDRFTHTLHDYFWTGASEATMNDMDK